MSIYTEFLNVYTQISINTQSSSIYTEALNIDTQVFRIYVEALSIYIQISVYIPNFQYI